MIMMSQTWEGKKNVCEGKRISFLSIHCGRRSLLRFLFNASDQTGTRVRTSFTINFFICDSPIFDSLIDERRADDEKLKFKSKGEENATGTWWLHAREEEMLREIMIEMLSPAVSSEDSSEELSEEGRKRYVSQDEDETAGKRRANRLLLSNGHFSPWIDFELYCAIHFPHRHVWPSFESHTQI